MSKYFILDASNHFDDYVYASEGTKTLSRACIMSEFQFLDNSPIEIEVNENSGNIFQDFIYEDDNYVPLVSDKFKDFLDVFGIDNIFYKKIILTKKNLGIEEIYWLALPPRINCLNRRESIIDETLDYATKIVITDSMVGRYDIFKLSGIGNPEIIVTEKLAEALQKENLTGLFLTDLDMI